MIPIKIDISDVAKEFSLQSQQIKNLKATVLDSIVASFVQTWERKAMKELHNSRRQYLDAIYVDKVDENSAIVGLNPKNKLAIMIEGGASSFDMKEGFAKSSKVKYNSAGEWYLTVPFRHATPGAIGDSETFSGKLPKEIYDLAKANYESGRRSGLTRQELPKEFQARGSNPLTGYEHKASLFEGLKRVDVSSTSKENRGAYMTFRRVSENSPANSWIHKGMNARNLMQKSLNQLDIPTLVDNVTNNFLGNL